MEYKYDVFISYRRDGGSERAELIKLMLEKNGIDESRIFMDTHSIYSCNFKQRLKEAIFQAKNFILIITKGCFESIKENDYWVFEIEEALSLGKKIVPVFFDGINSIAPNLLPDSIKQLHEINGVFYHHQYADAFFFKLMAFIDDSYIAPTKKKEKSNILYTKNWVLYFIAPFIILSTIIIYINYSRSQQSDASPNIDHSIDTIKRYQPHSNLIDNTRNNCVKDVSNDAKECTLYQKENGWNVEDLKVREGIAYKEFYNNENFLQLVREILSNRKAIHAPDEWNINEGSMLVKVEKVHQTEQWYLHFKSGTMVCIGDVYFRLGIQSFIEMFHKAKYEQIKYEQIKL